MYIVSVSYIGGGNRSNWRKPPSYQPVASHRQTLSHNFVSSTPQQYFSYIVEVHFYWWKKPGYLEKTTDLFSPGTLASSTTKTGRHDIAEILLKVASNTKIQNSNSSSDFPIIDYDKKKSADYLNFNENPLLIFKIDHL